MTDEVVCYVHEGRPFSLHCDERLAVAQLDVLPEDALAVPDEDIDALALAGAELVEAFCGWRRK